MRVPKNNELLYHAKKLRRQMTAQERKLWYLFLRTYPVKVYKQRIIDSYIVDFYCARAKLVIEVDGSQHYEENGLYKDGNRAYALKQYGLEVMHISNRDIDMRFQDVCEAIHRTIQKR